MPSSTYDYFSELYRPELAKAGTHFFCHACLVHRPVDDRSPDERYCQQCFEFLSDEMAAAKKNNQKQAAWWPKITAEKQPQETAPEKCAKNAVEIANNKTLPTRLFAQPDNEPETPDGGLKGRPVMSLPMEKILAMFASGEKVPDIKKQLEAEGIKVSRRSLYYIKAGQRVLV